MFAGEGPVVRGGRPGGHMPEVADQRTLRASRPVRRFAQFSGCVGALVGCLYAVMGLMGQGVRLLVPALLVLLVLVVRPLLILGGRTVLGQGAILVRRPPATRAV